MSPLTKACHVAAQAQDTAQDTQRACLRVIVCLSITMKCNAVSNVQYC